MILRAKASCVQATHVPASTYTGKDGNPRQRPETWECLLKYESSVYSRAKKATVRCNVEDLHESRVELKPGVEYEIVVEPSVSFGELRITIVEARELKPAPKA